MPFQLNKPRNELSNIKANLHEVTDADEIEEFSWLADVFAPQHNKRVPENTARLGKRVHLTAADKKEGNKASIGLPIARTLKLFTYNCRPFILEDTIPLGEFRKRYLSQLINTRLHFRSYYHSALAVQQRTSLSGTTLHSRKEQKTLAALQDLAPGSAQDLQNGRLTNDIASPVTLASHLKNVKPEVLVKVYTWLDNVDIPVAAEPGSSNSFSDFVVDEDVWELIERSARQRKSRLRQMPNTMSTVTYKTSIRGSNGSRPSESYPRPVESNTRTVTNQIKDHPGISARRPKNMPSGSQLPSCWNDDMDEFICHMEAQCEFSTKSIVRALKNRFSELREVSPSFCSSKAVVIYADTALSM